MRQEGRLKNKVADQEVIGPEEYHADVVSLSVQFEKHERQRLELLHVESTQGSTPEDDQRGEMKEAV
jgi:hypothetical protein